MKRAFVLVGVGRTGRLPTLPAVAGGLQAIRDWIQGQGVPDELITSLDDSDGSPVEVGQVFQAIKTYADSRTVEQLVVYFCGHGVVNDGSELWLLSGAPDDPSAAVNVAKSVRLAERGVIPHVVLLSDACRSQAASLQFGEVTGSSAFPNPNTAGSGKVDVFYATRVGENAHQVAEEQAGAAIAEAARVFHAVWSEVVAEALSGAHPRLLETVSIGGSEVDVVRPWSLDDALPGLLSERLAGLGVLGQVIQVPYSRITSNSKAVWLSQLPHVAPAAPSPAAPAPPPAPPPPSDAEPPTDGEQPRRPRRNRGGRQLVDEVPPTRPPAPVKVDPADVWASDAASRLTLAAQRAGDAPLTVLSVTDNGPESTPFTIVRRDSSAVLATTGELVLLLPNFGGRRCTVFLEEGGVVDVRWRSSPQELTTDPLWRSTVASRARFGLRWPGAVPDEAIERAVEASGEDPSVAVYVAYGLVEAGFRSHVPVLLERLRAQAAPVPYDVALLAEDLSHHDGPAIPLLTTGWSLLGDDGVAPMPSMPGRYASLWTAFRPGSIDTLEHLLSLPHP